VVAVAAGDVEHMTPIVIGVKNLIKTYVVGEVEVRALRGVNLEVQRGEFIAVTGPSGSGKSTFMHIVGCLDRPTSGQYFLDGEDVSRMSKDQLANVRNRKIGFVFQRFNLLPTLTAKGNIAIAQFIHGDGFDPHRFDVVTQMLGLAGRLHHKPSELSGGEQQRVAIARAIINEPKILLADEPTGNLDSKNSETVLQMLRQLNKDLGQTIVMITHNPEATTYFDRVVHMRDGVIVDGVPAD